MDQKNIKFKGSDWVPKDLTETINLAEQRGIASRSAMNNYIEKIARQKGVPIRGIFELTPLCNLDCKMCYVHLSADQLGGRKLLSVEQWKLLIKQAVDAGLMYATLTGGECMLYPQFDELYLYLQSFGVRVGIITNGILLTENRIRFFLEHRPESIQVSFYGASEDGYENVTGHRVFEQVKRNTLRAIEAGLPVKAGITSSSYMGKEDEALIGLLVNLKIPFTINSTLFSARPETGRKLEDYIQSESDFIRLRSAYLKLKHEVLPEPCADNAFSGNCLKGIQCGAGNSGFCIDWRGDMYACAMLPDIKESALETDFRTAWNTVHSEAKRYPNPQECSTCAYQPLCPACVAAHRDGAQPGHANPNICALTKAMIAVQNRKENT